MYEEYSPNMSVLPDVILFKDIPSVVPIVLIRSEVPNDVDKKIIMPTITNKRIELFIIRFFTFDINEINQQKNKMKIHKINILDKDRQLNPKHDNKRG